MPLNRRQIIELSAAIKERRSQLLEDIRRGAANARGEPYAAVAGSTHDAGDESVADLIADLGRADLERDLVELCALDRAGERLADGSYGTCVGCGGDIGLERLRARPDATRCHGCQERFEKTHAAAAGKSL